MNETTEMSFRLEHEILECWGILEQLDTLTEGVLEHELTTDQISNILIGLKDLYQIKFTKAFDTFESLHGDVCRLTKE